MNNEIIGFKLIKLYPLSPELHYTINGLSKKLTNIYSQFPEFWEPIYEEVGVDLSSILNEQEIDWNSCSYRGVVVNAMKEACKQTLELVKKHVRIECLPQGVSVDLKLTHESIDNILTMIK